MTDDGTARGTAGELPADQERKAEARRERDLSHSALQKVQDPEEREVVESDLAGIPL